MQETLFTCTSCGEDKPENDYYKAPSRASGRSGYCKGCMRAKSKAWQQANPERTILHSRRAYLKRAFGMTLEEYDEMCAKVGHACEACGGNEDVLCIDHDHSTGEIRGILCADCNKALGFARDNPKALAGLLHYLMSRAA